MDQYKFFDRDYSWLSFNDRVLMEAKDPRVPIYERIKFLAIYSSNLDEFFRVRVAALRSIVNIDKKKINKKFDRAPRELLDNILEEVHRQQVEFGEIKREQIIPELKKNGIFLYREEPIRQEHVAFVESFFKSRILSYLQPVILTSGKSRKPFLENRALYFAIDMTDPAGERQYAYVNIPSDRVERFIAMPKIDGMYYYIAIDDIIREHIHFLFPKYTIHDCYSIKLNRDADLNIEDEFSGNLVKKIQKQIAKRNLGVPSRFLYDHRIPGDLLEFLRDYLELTEEDLVPGGRYHNMNDLFDLPNPLSPQLENQPLEKIRIASLDDAGSILDEVAKRDIMLHFPYQSYDYVLRFFNEAAFDPDVREIKITFYRIAHDSFISNALISAAHNGKKVTVFVEIKARFDEANNLRWAEKMQEAGIDIIYSIPGLKVHAKVALIIREEQGRRRSYAYFGTGNFNEKTADIYADEGLLTCHKRMCWELDAVFDYLDNEETEPVFSELLISQFNITDRLNLLIDKEIDNARAGKPARIILKLNNLQDDIMIRRLYEACREGVSVHLIVRAICCAVPEQEVLKNNLIIKRIVDRYLEHSRVYYFENGGDPLLFMGSADWMKRNLYRRIEVVFPIYAPGIRKQILEMLRLQWLDNRKATYINKDLKNIPVVNEQPPVQSQLEFYHYLRTQE